MSDSDAIDSALRDLLHDQQERQQRLRHVQEFMTTPVFLDLAELSADVSDDAEALAERRRDLDYRIDILSSVLELLREEKRAIGRIRPHAGTDQDSPAAHSGAQGASDPKETERSNNKTN
ncbi:MAG: hypothetical protein AAFS01_00245 [Pseudomonadota bacterium]